MRAEPPLNLAQVTIRGTCWMYASRFSGKVMVFISMLILTRLLTKEEFGLAGYAIVVISFLDVLRDLGIGSALIYHRDDPQAAHTAFWLSLGIGVGLCLLTWLGAPLVGAFFQDARAVSITRLLALSFPLNALANVHETLLYKRLAFRGQFTPSLMRAMSKGLISILLAMLGFGVWSLIIGQLAGLAVSVLAYWRALAWRPSCCFARHLAHALLSYGMRIVSVNTLAMVLLNVDYLFIGRFLGAATLGVYTVGFRIPELLILQLCDVIRTVIFPVYVKMRDDPMALSDAFLQTLRYVSMVTVGLGVGAALLAEPFVLTFFTADWIDIIPVIQGTSIYALLLSLSYNAGSVYKAQGRPEVLTKIAALRVALLVPALWWAVTGPGSIAVVGWTHALVALITSLISLVVAGRLLNIPLSIIISALRPAVLCGMVMALAIAGVLHQTTAAPPLLQLVIAAAVGGGVYAASFWWLQQDFVLHVYHMLRSVILRR